MHDYEQARSLSEDGPPVKRFRPNHDPGALFVAIGNVVMKGSERICTACSNNMAKRIANALRIYRPSPKGK